jgi:hypothetical protein
MPLTKVDYTKAVIYKIYCLDETIKDCYIGLTTDFIRRKYNHKHCSQLKNLKLYNVIREYGGWDNWKIEIIYKFENDECVDKCYCEKIETNFINEHVATLNSNKFDRKKYDKEWYSENLERIRQKNKDKKVIFYNNKLILDEYWSKQYNVNLQPDWYLNNIKNRRY